MKFSNFVSSLAVVCLAFNADAVQLENRSWHKTNLSNAQLEKMWLEKTKMRKEKNSFIPVPQLDSETAHDVCMYGIDKMIKPEWKKAG